MQIITDIQYLSGSKEEYLPGYTESFPFIASLVKLHEFPAAQAPWHWHDPVEFFYVKKGTLQYQTPNESLVFPEGSGGFINANVLHMTQSMAKHDPLIQYVMLFDPILISGWVGSKVDRDFVRPLVAQSKTEIIPFYPNSDVEKEMIDLIVRISEQKETNTYQLVVKNQLVLLWEKLFLLTSKQEFMSGPDAKVSEAIKNMMIYIFDHYQEKITVSEIALSIHRSERECYRLFKKYLRISPIDFLTNHRIQQACLLLAKTDLGMTEIAQQTGLGSSSYFAKIFGERIGTTPTAYRLKCQHRDK